MDLQEWLDLAVDGELVADDPIEAEQVVEQLAVGVEDFVAEDHRNIEFAARQPEAGRLVAGVLVVEDEKESGESLVHILRGEIDTMVVIPERAERLAGVAEGCELF